MLRPRPGRCCVHDHAASPPRRCCPFCPRRGGAAFPPRRCCVPAAAVLRLRHGGAAYTTVAVLRPRRGGAASPPRRRCRVHDGGSTASPPRRCCVPPRPRRRRDGLSPRGAGRAADVAEHLGLERRDLARHGVEGLGGLGVGLGAAPLPRAVPEAFDGRNGRGAGRALARDLVPEELAQAFHVLGVGAGGVVACAPDRWSGRGGEFRRNLDEVVRSTYAPRGARRNFT